ncbi:MAG: hypothetical protein LKF71_01195 [Oscillospiraceae bacterium]|jgi:hypothetical protein|nr:hypothetical protein [Oscillospiraceae bacterium]
MPSSKKTTHGLNLWESDDHPMREDFVSDNQTMDDLFSKHIADTTLHKTPYDGTPMMMGNYCGDGKADHTISLGFDPQAVIVFACGVPAVQKDAAGNLILYAGAAGDSITTGGVEILYNGGFDVHGAVTSQGTSIQLNQDKQAYGYMAFR